MDAAGARARRLETTLLGDVQLRAHATGAHLVHVHDVPRVLGVRVLAHGTHPDRPQHGVRRRDRRHAQRDGTQPPDLVLRRHRAPVPGVRVANAIVGDEREPLALGVLEVERQSRVALHDLSRPHAQLAEPHLPVVERLGVGHAQRGTRDRSRAARLGRHRPVEEGEVGPRCPLRVGVEQMISAHVVLVHGTLDEAHPHGAGIEVMVVPDLRRDRRQMVDALQLDAHVGSLLMGARCHGPVDPVHGPCAPCCKYLSSKINRRQAGMAPAPLRRAKRVRGSHAGQGMLLATTRLSV